MLEEFGPDLYVANGPAVSFYGFPHPTRMAVAKLSDNSAWVWSPVGRSEELASAVDAIGPVGQIVSPNKLHHLFLGEWAKRWPDARLYAPPGLARKRLDLRFDAELADEPDPAWAADIDQVIFRSSLRWKRWRSSTRFPESEMSGWMGTLMRLDRNSLATRVVCFRWTRSPMMAVRDPRASSWASVRRSKNWASLATGPVTSNGSWVKNS
jgi:hypothetical protein